MFSFKPWQLALNLGSFNHIASTRCWMAGELPRGKGLLEIEEAVQEMNVRSKSGIAGKDDLEKFTFFILKASEPVKNMSMSTIQVSFM
jgi:hypothetical protein